VRRASVLFVLLLTLGGAFSAFSAKASPICYRIKISLKGSVLVDQIVGLGCTGSGRIVSVVQDQVGDLTVRTTRYMSG